MIPSSLLPTTLSLSSLLLALVVTLVSEPKVYLKFPKYVLFLIRLSKIVLCTHNLLYS